MRRTEGGLELNLTDITTSAIRAFAHASGGDPDALPPGDLTERWLKACQWAVPNLPSFDGRPASEAVAAFLIHWADGDPALLREQDAYLTEWEAVVRHLNLLIDSDELRDEADVIAWEQSWASWVQSRPRRIREG